MAIDTRDKRASAIHVGLPWRGLLPVPDGSLNQGDRQQLAFVYRGIEAVEPEEPEIIPAPFADTVRIKRTIENVVRRP